MAPRVTPLEQRFWYRVLKSDSCWNWIGGLCPNGYGGIWIGDGSGKRTSAHRISWTLKNGPIPDGLCVLHHCDNRRCVNPDHLYVGTKRDNIMDMIRRNRYVPKPPAPMRGEENPISKLTDEKVREIRLLRGILSHRKIAAVFGVSQPVIGKILRGQSWSHVE